MKLSFPLVATAALCGLAGDAASQTTSYPPMMRGDTPATGNGWTATALATVSETTLAGYQAPGVLDGMGAFPYRGGVAVLVSHELNAGSGYAYTLANGTQLTGARISTLLLRRDGANWTLAGARPAFDTIHDRAGVVVTDPAQVNETGNNIDGLARLCSATAVQPGTYGFVDPIYFAGEETGVPSHPHGGSEWALDVRGGALWAVPAMGRGAWENVTPIDSGDPSTVALLCGDDSASAPLYLYIGEKDAVGDQSFLDRNGLKQGKLYAWKADSGDLDPQTFHGLNEVRTGSWVEVTVRNPALAGQPGYDAAGYADIDTLQAEADALGCFSFSRPEDLSVNPLDGSQVAFASTGRGSLYPADNWGTVYVIDTDVQGKTATLVIVHDADGLAIPDEGIRSPDNLTWGGDGKIYVQEDKSTSPGALFGAATGVEASVWALDPITRAYTRIGEIDRSAVAPAGSTDSNAGELGAWESSGVIDITDMVPTAPGERVLLLNVQAHGVNDGVIAANGLVESGQLLVLTKDV